MQNISATALEILETGSLTGVSMSCSNGLTITGDDIIQGTLSIDRNSVSGSVIEIGNAETTELLFTLDNHDGRFNSYSFSGHTLTVNIILGAEMLRAGVFTIDNSPKKIETMKISALDNMAKFNKEFIAPSSATLSSLLEHCCSRCGVTPYSTTFTNSDVDVKIPTSKTTYHRVIGLIAELAGSNAYIDSDGKLRIEWYGENQSETPEINANTRFDYEADEQVITITGLSYYDGRITETIGSDEYAIKIESNELMPDEAAPILNAIYSKINGYKYLPYSFSILPMPHLWPLDEISILMPDGVTTVNSIITNHNFTLNGRSLISAIGKSQQNKIYQPVPSLTPNQTTESTSLVNSSLLEHLEDSINNHLSRDQKKGLTGGAERLKTINLGLSGSVDEINQDITNYNDFEVEAEIIREQTAITTPEYWQEILVKSASNVTSTSVTVQYDIEGIGNIYVAYVSDGTLFLRSAQFKHPVSQIIWQDELNISGCVNCSLVYDGSFITVGDNVEYYTDELPWLFYTTTTGELKAGILGGSYETLVGANVTSLDAIRGVASKYHDIDQGLIVFYVLDGGVYYREYIAGMWSSQYSVGLAPANVVRVRAERVFDYRIVLHVEDNTGALYEIFTKMDASGWNGSEYLAINNLSITEVKLIDVYYSDCEYPESLEIAGLSVEPYNMSVYPPVLLRAWNVPIMIEDPENPEALIEDFGRCIIFEFDQNLRNAEDFPSAFKLTDAYNVTWFGQTVEVNRRFVTVTFADFNNASNPITTTALAGDLSNGYTTLEETSVEFEAEGLVPTFVPVPEPITIWNTDNRTIFIEFDRPIVDIASQSGFVVSGYEPNRSPVGELIPTNYEITGITGDPEDTTRIIIALSYAGRMKHPQGDVTITFTGSLFGPGGGQVAPFILPFTPANLVLWFNPNDPEYLVIQGLDLSVIRKKISYIDQHYPEPVHVHINAITITATLIHVNDIET